MSLRLRAAAAGVIWAIIVTFIGTFVIGGYIEQQTVSRFEEQLQSRHDRLVVALANSFGDATEFAYQISDPVYQIPFSGHYWQVENEATGDKITSRSLNEVTLPIGVTEAAGTAKITDISGPVKQILRVATEHITLIDGSNWTLSTASTIEPLIRDQQALNQRLGFAKLIISFMAIVGALLIAVITLRPVAKLRHDVESNWNSNSPLKAAEYPQEVQPLVNGLNELLERNRNIVDRSRRQTADLAHALKTPAAIVRNELEALERTGQNMTQSIQAMDRLDAQLARSLARMRAEQGSAAEYTSTEMDVSLGRLVRAFDSLAKNSQKSIDAVIEPNLAAGIHQNDFEEVIGNLLDNALKWSKSAISLRAESSDDQLKIYIEDDGPGIPENDRDKVFASGQRLDETKPGTGLGLAIACELTRAYKGKLGILKSQSLGGAKFEVTLPLAN